LDHWSGAVGTNIKAYCKGFHAGKEVSIQYYSTAVSEVVASQVASDTGECTVQFMLPVSSTGAHDVIAKNEVGDFAKAEFEVIPILSINPPSGGVGDKINIIGTGFTGSNLGTVFHFPGGQTAAGWHTYGMIWTKGQIQYYVDDPAKIYATFTPSTQAGTWPFDAGPQFILLNLAVGGTWPKSPDATTVFPSDMQVDYVRLYTN